MNGFGGMGAGVAKAVGPILAGFWLAHCLSWDATTDSDDNSSSGLGLQVPIGSLVAFAGIASLGLILVAMLPLLRDED